MRAWGPHMIFQFLARSYYDRERIMNKEEAERAFGVALAACPFCFSGDVGIFLGPHPHVTCLTCSADGPMTASRDHAHAACYMWNNRTQPERIERDRRRRRV